jgi:hypothetical protein
MEFRRVDYKRKRSNIKSLRGSKMDDRSFSTINNKRDVFEKGTLE